MSDRLYKLSLGYSKTVPYNQRGVRWFALFYLSNLSVRVAGTEPGSNDVMGLGPISDASATIIERMLNYPVGNYVISFNLGPLLAPDLETYISRLREHFLQTNSFLASRLVLSLTGPYGRSLCLLLS